MKRRMRIIVLLLSIVVIVTGAILAKAFKDAMAQQRLLIQTPPPRQEVAGVGLKPAKSCFNDKNQIVLQKEEIRTVIAYLEGLNLSYTCAPLQPNDQSLNLTKSPIFNQKAPALTIETQSCLYVVRNFESLADVMALMSELSHKTDTIVLKQTCACASTAGPTTYCEQVVIDSVVRNFAQ